jgi:hypothetical protein
LGLNLKPRNRAVFSWSSADLRRISGDITWHRYGTRRAPRRWRSSLRLVLAGFDDPFVRTGHARHILGVVPRPMPIVPPLGASG